MKILLAGISAKFIHQNLAVDALRLYAEEQYGIRCCIAEFTINQPFDMILAELYRQKPDLLGFSCYIWNWELIRRLVRAIRKIDVYKRQDKKYYSIYHSQVQGRKMQYPVFFPDTT